MTHPDLNNQAERAVCKTCYGVGLIGGTSLEDQEKKFCPDCWPNNAAPPALDAEGLPPLPTKKYEFTSPKTGWFTARQMQDYARQAQRDAVADRPTWADVQAREKDIRVLQSEVIDLRAQLARQSAPEGAPVGMGDVDDSGCCMICLGFGELGGESCSACVEREERRQPARQDQQPAQHGGEHG